MLKEVRIKNLTWERNVLRTAGSGSWIIGLSLGTRQRRRLYGVKVQSCLETYERVYIQWEVPSWPLHVWDPLHLELVWLPCQQRDFFYNPPVCLIQNAGQVPKQGDYFMNPPVHGLDTPKKIEWTRLSLQKNKYAWCLLGTGICNLSQHTLQSCELLFETCQFCSWTDQNVRFNQGSSRALRRWHEWSWEAICWYH